ncbi:FkbM family methyltransferase [Azospirillum fermentarium]|uniref:FkbM family methyltransferase n=1 Tax=Azospirillum fermentarium TaxID=1233114 RepID=UPI0022264FBD|nr:FkbM family methyltransferase [Azospirillum fermentarium]MCW2246948.1 FkbM family methyltransferase [Azospirillum fermentarium]
MTPDPAFLDSNIKTYTFTVAGQNFAIINDGNDGLLAGSLAETRSWEPWHLDVYARVIRRGSVCLDVGGNIGTSALAMAVFAAEGHVYSFEPVEHTFAFLRRNVEQNAVANVTPVQLGLSDGPGEAEIVVDRTMLGNARQLTPGERINLADRGMRYVQTIRLEGLDRWMRSAGVSHAGFIKVDVEGHEIEVLAGGAAAFAHPGTVAIFEFAVAPQRKAGSTVFPEMPRDVLFFRALSGRFPYLFLMGRDSRLHRVGSYAQLRCLMIAGDQVDDLLCCHTVPEGLGDAVAGAAPLPVREWGTALSGPAGVFVLLNRYDDGWSLGTPAVITGTRSGLCAVLAEPVELTLEFGPVYTKHSERAAHPVMLAVNEDVRFHDVTDRASTVTVPLKAGTNWLFLESEYALEARSYLGNPGDPRTVGFRFVLSGLERGLG